MATRFSLEPGATSKHDDECGLDLSQPNSSAFVSQPIPTGIKSCFLSRKETLLRQPSYCEILADLHLPESVLNSNTNSGVTQTQYDEKFSSKHSTTELLRRRSSIVNTDNYFKTENLSYDVSMNDNVQVKFEVPDDSLLNSDVVKSQASAAEQLLLKSVVDHTRNSNPSTNTNDTHLRNVQNNRFCDLSAQIPSQPPELLYQTSQQQCLNRTLLNLNNVEQIPDAKLQILQTANEGCLPSQQVLAQLTDVASKSQHHDGLNSPPSPTTASSPLLTSLKKVSGITQKRLSMNSTNGLSTTPSDSKRQSLDSSSLGHFSSSSSNGVDAVAISKRQLRLLKNREAARECRIKKKEYIWCLENRVSVLENRNKLLMEQLKAMKQMYGHVIPEGELSSNDDSIQINRPGDLSNEDTTSQLADDDV